MKLGIPGMTMLIDECAAGSHWGELYTNEEDKSSVL